MILKDVMVSLHVVMVMLTKWIVLLIYGTSSKPIDANIKKMSNAHVSEKLRGGELSVND